MPIDVNENNPPPLKEQALMPSTLETIDFAMYQFLDEELDVRAETNKGWKKVPVIWATSERAVQSRQGQEIRDEFGTLKLPLISVERTGISKDPGRRSALQGGIPNALDAKGGAIVVARRIHPEKTAEFTNALSAKKKGSESLVGTGQKNFPGISKPVYETITIPFPTYMELTYTIKIKAEYQQQMNDILAPFLSKTGGINYFICGYDGHRYEGFLPNDLSFENSIADLGSEYRSFETSFEIKIIGYIIGADKNSSQPKIVKRQSYVEVKIGRERALLEDEIENYLKHENGPPGIKGKYRP